MGAEQPNFSFGSLLSSFAVFFVSFLVCSGYLVPDLVNKSLIEGNTLNVRRLQYVPCICLERIEQRLNDLFLSWKMVVEIARADIHLVGNFIGCRSGFAFFVEQQQARDQYSVSGISTHLPTMGQKAC